MQINQTPLDIRFYRERSKEAISLATKGQWQKAAEANKSLLSRFPKDVETFNRLGKALSELGLYAEARIAFQNAKLLLGEWILERKKRMEYIPNSIKQLRMICN